MTFVSCQNSPCHEISGCGIDNVDAQPLLTPSHHLTLESGKIKTYATVATNQYRLELHQN